MLVEDEACWGTVSSGNNLMAPRLKDCLSHNVEIHFTVRGESSGERIASRGVEGLLKVHTADSVRAWNCDAR